MESGNMDYKKAQAIRFKKIKLILSLKLPLLLTIAIFAQISTKDEEFSSRIAMARIGSRYDAWNGRTTV